MGQRDHLETANGDGGSAHDAQASLARADGGEAGNAPWWRRWYGGVKAAVAERHVCEPYGQADSWEQIGIRRAGVVVYDGSEARYHCRECDMLWRGIR